MKHVTYKDSGVDVKTGDEASFRSYMIAKSTYRPEVKEIKGIPTFAASFKGYKQPVLLGATDGVGTKLRIAFQLNTHHTIGIDLVAMCVNDLIRRGAEPIMFLPYLATSKVVPETSAAISEGIAEGCRQARCTIMGGETAELPDFYQPGEYDLAGSATGVVDKDKVITGEAIEEGDVVFGLPSSGIHSNGYSLARKVLLSHYTLNDAPPELEGKTIGEELLTPTRIYVSSILCLLKEQVEIHGLAHITGGGLPSKFGKIIPSHLAAELEVKTWFLPPIFSLIQKRGPVETAEMFSTFNMGVGFVIVVPPKAAKQVAECCLEAVRIGQVVNRSGKEAVVLN